MNNQLNDLLTERDSLLKELEKVENRVEELSNQSLNQEYVHLKSKPISLSPVSKNKINFDKILQISKEINGGISFSNIEEHNSDENNNILYEVDGTVDFLNFKMWVLLNGTTKAIKKLKLTLDHKQDDAELMSTINMLKRKGNPMLLFSSLKQYTVCSNQRRETLEFLQVNFKGYFEFSREEDSGIFIIECKTSKKSYFSCTWAISWSPVMFCLCHHYEISVVDNNNDLDEEISTHLFNQLCKKEKVDENLNRETDIWNKLAIMVKAVDTREYLQN